MLKKSGLSQNLIAKQLKISQPTVSKELKRNRGEKGYRHKQAHEKALIRRSKKSSKKKKMTQTLLFKVEKMLDEKLSPEQISSRLKRVESIQISMNQSINIFGKIRRRVAIFTKTYANRVKKEIKEGTKKLAEDLFQIE